MQSNTQSGLGKRQRQQNQHADYDYELLLSDCELLDDHDHDYMPTAERGSERGSWPRKRRRTEWQEATALLMEEVYPSYEKYGMEPIACAPDAPETRGKRTKQQPDRDVDSECLLDLETTFMQVAMQPENHDKGRGTGGFTGKTHTPEAREAIGAAQTERWAKPGAREAQIERFLGKTDTPETTARRSATAAAVKAPSQEQVDKAAQLAAAEPVSLRRTLHGTVRNEYTGSLKSLEVKCGVLTGTLHLDKDKDKDIRMMITPHGQNEPVRPGRFVELGGRGDANWRRAIRVDVDEGSIGLGVWLSLQRQQRDTGRTRAGRKVQAPTRE